MSERGVFALDRGWFDHPSFAREPFTEREAWAWLIAEAAFKERTKRIGSVVVKLDRGQVAASLRFMADKWDWSEPKVRRFLKRLKTDAMLTGETTQGITVLTICNYAKYQRVSLPRDAANDAQTDAGATQERRKVEDTKSTEEDSEANASGAGAPDPSVAERELFERGKAVLGKSSGGQIVKLLRAKGGNVALARAAIEAASQKHRPAEYVAACIRGSPQAQGPPPDKGGFVAILMDKHLERQNGQGTFDEDEFEYRASG